MLLAPLLADLPTRGAWIGYADNFLAMGKSEEDVVSINSAFWSAAKAHPARAASIEAPLSSSPGYPSISWAMVFDRWTATCQDRTKPREPGKIQSQIRVWTEVDPHVQRQSSIPCTTSQALREVLRNSTFRSAALGIEQMRMQALKRIADAAV